ncbi:MAG TPA: PqqD family peptide modification chaperone, partial [Acidimicrobiales bacterium]
CDRVPQPLLEFRLEARGFPFDVQCEEAVRPILDTMFGQLARSSGAPRATFKLIGVREGQNEWNVVQDGRLMMGCPHLSDALHGLMVFVNQAVIAGRPDLLCIHAASVALAGAGVLLPASSGSGKTTLCGRLLQRGAEYLTDDSVGLAGEGLMLGYPRPLGFKWRGEDRFADVDLTGLQLDSLQLVWQVPAARLGASTVASTQAALVAVPRFERGAELRIEPLTRHASARHLIAQAQNMGAVGLTPALHLLGGLVARCQSYSLTYGDARDAAGMIETMVEVAAGQAPVPYRVVPAADIAPEAGAGLGPVADVGALCFDDGGILVRAGTGDIATIDHIGARVWPLLDGRRDLDEVVGILATDFAAPEDQVRTDVSLWLEELTVRGFLRRGEAARPV